MNKKILTCIECPIGCEIEVELEDGVVKSVKGHSCPRGKMYAENEIVCPKRVLTSTVRAKNGKMVPVKTDKPIKKSEMFAIMKIINTIRCEGTEKIGDILLENISDDANLVVSGNV